MPRRANKNLVVHCHGAGEGMIIQMVDAQNLENRPSLHHGCGALFVDAIDLAVRFHQERVRHMHGQVDRGYGLAGEAVIGVCDAADRALRPAAASADTLVSVGSNPAPFPQNKQNEPTVAVDPINSSIVIGGSNDEIDEPNCDGIVRVDSWPS